MNTPTADIEYDSETDSFSVIYRGVPLLYIHGPHKASDKELCQRIADEINSGRLEVYGITHS